MAHSAGLALGQGGGGSLPLAARPRARARRISAWSFEITEPVSKRQKSAHRRQVADYVSLAFGAEVVAGETYGRRLLLFVRCAHPVSEEAARSYVAECPGVVAHSFAVSSGVG
jgi:hypothetical protein